MCPMHALGMYVVDLRLVIPVDPEHVREHVQSQSTLRGAAYPGCGTTPS